MMYALSKAFTADCIAFSPPPFVKSWTGDGLETGRLMAQFWRSFDAPGRCGGSRERKRWCGVLATDLSPACPRSKIETGSSSRAREHASLEVMRD